MIRLFVKMFAMVTGRVSLLLVVMVLRVPSVLAEINAIQITEDNAPQFVQHGPDAVGGIGDWYISNGLVCAVISDIEHEGEFSSQGGVLTDLGFCNRADDHLTFIQDLLDGKRETPINVSRIEIDKSRDSVAIVTYGQQGDVVVMTRYSFNEQDPSQLSIVKKIQVDEGGEAHFNLYSSTWFNYHSLETFIFSANESAKSRGFQNIDIVTRGVSALKEALSNANTVVLMSPPDAEYPIAYGWHLKSVKRVTNEHHYALPAFIFSDEESTGVLVLADRFYVGDGQTVGLLQLPQIPFLSLSDNDYIEIEETVYVGARADVASISDQLMSDYSTILGRLSESNSALHISDRNGDPVTFVRPDSDGEFEFKLPPGDYHIEHRGTANRSSERSLQVKAQGTDTDMPINLGELTLPKPGELGLPHGHAMRLVFVGINGTSDPDFESTLTGYAVHSDQEIFQKKAIRQLFLAGVESDPTSVALAPGTYRVYATRGPEYSLSMVDITITAGKQVQLIIEPPEHVVETPGFIAADLHVHSGMGYDNAFSTRARVKTFVAEHAEVMVSSEHDVPVDFEPVIAAMKVSDKITSIAAVEMTSLLPTEQFPYTGGHVNFFPVLPKALEYRKGMINHENRRLRAILADFQHEHPEAIAQLNHARQNLSLSAELPDDYQSLIDHGAYLDHMGSAAHPYNPQQSIQTYPNNYLIEADPESGIRDIDFQAMEIINPGGPYHQERIVALRRDWLSFIQQGFHITGTANSDSHHSGQQVGLPRTMVATLADRVETFDEKAFIDSIKSGNVYGTTGPMLRVSLSNSMSSAQMGETLSGEKGVLNVSVKSADWIPLGSIAIQVNAKTVIESNLNGNTELAFDLAFTQDSFVTIEVSGEASEEYNIIYPEITPYAFTNPIYVDFDRDGEWRPPGL